MLVNFDPAIASMFPADRVPNEVDWATTHFQSAERKGLRNQLEGAWTNCMELSNARHRAFVQLVAHHREMEPQSSRLRYLMGDRQLDDDAVGLIEKIATRHAYVATVTISLIDKAKSTNGVLPSSEFYWARRLDPAFWLMINGYGRPKHPIEIAGAFAHYAFEKANGRSEDTYFKEFDPD